MMIIDPPVTPYSSPDEIRGWLKELREMRRDESVIAAIREAEEWIKDQDAD